MGVAVELYFDTASEQQLRQLQDRLTSQGIPPILEQVGFVHTLVWPALPRPLPNLSFHWSAHLRSPVTHSPSRSRILGCSPLPRELSFWHPHCKREREKGV
jgi:hypothetical protein